MRCLAIAAGVAFCVSACAIHPQPQDFSRNFLPEIVYKVRCEAQSAVVATFGRTLTKKQKDIAVAFDFDFVLTETNDATTNGSLAIPVALGTFTLGWSAGAEKERKSTQELKFEDSFGDLLAIPYCQSTERRNYKYPITGNIGLVGTFDNFARVVAQRPDGKISGFFDEVEFTTKITGSVTPEVQLAPGSKKLTAEAKLLAERTDLHRVKLTFSLPSRPKPDKPLQVQLVDEKGNVIVPGGPSARTLNKATGSGPATPDNNKARARQQADETEGRLILEELQRRINRP